ncbi:MAG: hypothetical protein V4504_01035 [Patescibacteria group bacterium]
MENNDLESLDPKIQKKVCRAIIFLAILSLGSCKSSKESTGYNNETQQKSAKIPWTTAIRDTFNITGEETKIFQFYNAGPAVLVLYEDTNVKKITDGVLVYGKKRDSQIADLNNLTPGVVESYSKDLSTLNVRFTKKSFTALLPFKYKPVDGKYYLFLTGKENKAGEVALKYDNKTCLINVKYRSVYLVFDGAPPQPSKPEHIILEGVIVNEREQLDKDH